MPSGTQRHCPNELAAADGAVAPVSRRKGNRGTDRELRFDLIHRMARPDRSDLAGVVAAPLERHHRLPDRRNLPKATTGQRRQEPASHRGIAAASSVRSQKELPCVDHEVNRLSAGRRPAEQT